MFEVHPNRTYVLSKVAGEFEMIRSRDLNKCINYQPKHELYQGWKMHLNTYNIEFYLCKCLIILSRHRTRIIVNVRLCTESVRRWRQSAWALPLPTCWSSWRQTLRSSLGRRRQCRPRGSFRRLLHLLTFHPSWSSRGVIQLLICIRFRLCRTH